MSGGSGGGPTFTKNPITNFFTGTGDGSQSDQAGGGYSPAPDPAAHKLDLTTRIRADKNLDQPAKNDLLAQLDSNSDPASVEQKYATILDPQSGSGKELVYRKARAQQLDTPGLKKQTDFSPVAQSFLGGNIGRSDGGGLGGGFFG